MKEMDNTKEFYKNIHQLLPLIPVKPIPLYKGQQTTSKFGGFDRFFREIWKHFGTSERMEESRFGDMKELCRTDEQTLGNQMKIPPI